MKRFLGFAVVLAVFSGCMSGNREGLVPVSGNVTLDGQPVENGRILIRQQNGDQRAFGAFIVDGVYELEALPGDCRVEIRASRIVPGLFDNSNGVPEPRGEMYIPKRYNDQSELTAQISTEGRNELSFELRSP